MSEQSLVREGAGYDEVFQIGHELEEGLSWLSKRETLAYSPDEEVESCVGRGKKEEVVEGDEGEAEGDEEEEDDGDKGDTDERTLEVGSSGSPRSRHARPFILPKMWTVNDFLSKMTVNIFKNLRDRYQIPDHISIRLPGKFDKFYTGKTVNINMYDATFAAELRLPLTALHCQLANFLGLSVSQIAPNAWRIFIGAEILWGYLSGGIRQLSLDEFFWCYRPQHIILSQGIYHFTTRKKSVKAHVRHAWF